MVGSLGQHQRLMHVKGAGEPGPNARKVDAAGRVLRNTRLPQRLADRLFAARKVGNTVDGLGQVGRHDWKSSPNAG